VRRPQRRAKSSTHKRDDIDDPRLRLIDAIRQREQRAERRARNARIAAAGICGLLAVGGLTAGASALLSATTDIPFILQPPESEHDGASGQASTNERSLQARLLRVPANTLGPSLAIPIADTAGRGQAIPYATDLDLCLVVTPPLRRRTRYLPAINTFWNCYDKRNVARQLRAGGADFAYATLAVPPLIVGFARGDIARVTVRGAGFAMPARMTLPWRAGLPGVRAVRLWAAYPLSLLDRVRPREGSTDLSSLRVTATTRRGVTRRVPFP